MKLIGLLSDFSDETIIYYNKEDGKYEILLTGS